MQLKSRTLKFNLMTELDAEHHEHFCASVESVVCMIVQIFISVNHLMRRAHTNEKKNIKRNLAEILFFFCGFAFWLISESLKCI